jgi:L-ascorbate metabolism protein UlaG (beta-lactamase superfamily)
MKTGLIAVAFFLLLSFNAAFKPSCAAEVEVENMLTNLHWLGHDTFRIDGPKVIYFDPWKLPENSKKADLIFITHEHYDHYSLDDIRLISSAATVIVTDTSVARMLQKEKISCAKIQGLRSADTVEAAGIKAVAVSAYNLDKTYHTRASGKVGFIVDVQGVKLYHAGDTDFIPEMSEYSCDIALLPVSGTYVMDAQEASQAALSIRPKIAIPMHYGDIVGSVADARKFQDLLKGKIEVRILSKES